MSKEGAKEFGEIVKKSGENLKQEIVKRGLDADKVLKEKITKIDQGCQEAAEYIKKRTDEK